MSCLEEDTEIELSEVAEINSTNDREFHVLMAKNTTKYGSNNKVDMVDKTNPSDNVHCIEGRELAMQRFLALVYVRFRKFTRNGTSVVIQLFLPVVLLIVGLVLSKTMQSDQKAIEQQTARGLSSAIYTKMKTVPGQYFPYNTVPRLLLRDTVSE